MDVREAWREMTVVPRAAISLPLPLPIPPGFDARDLATWPQVEGRLEYIEGRLQFMPPCAEEQRTVVDVVGALFNWRRAHPEFVVGSNEAGMLLGGDVRAADAAVWRRADLGAVASNAMPRVAPLLAVEVAGRDEDRDTLLEKARWYLDHGVTTIWVVVPRTRTVSVVDATGVVDHGALALLPEPLGLPGLSIRVEAFFEQLDGR